MSSKAAGSITACAWVAMACAFGPMVAFVWFAGVMCGLLFSLLLEQEDA